MSSSSSPKKHQDQREATIRRFLEDGEFKANVAILDSAINPHTPRTVWGKLAGWCYGDYHKCNRISMYKTWKNNRDKFILEIGRKALGGTGQGLGNSQRCSSSSKLGNSQRCSSSSKLGNSQRCSSSSKLDYSALFSHRPTNGVKLQINGCNSLNPSSSRHIKRPLSSSTINTLMHKHPAASTADLASGSQLKGKRKRWNPYAPSSDPRWAKVDLDTPKSILVGKNLKTLINERTFMSLPSNCQQELLKLLPAPDRVSLGSKALNNEFFTQSCVEWVERLAEGNFTPENRLLLKSEDKDRCKIDEWKARHFEANWGDKLLPQQVLHEVTPHCDRKDVVNFQNLNKLLETAKSSPPVSKPVKISSTAGSAAPRATKNWKCTRIRGSKTARSSPPVLKPVEISSTAESAAPCATKNWKCTRIRGTGRPRSRLVCCVGPMAIVVRNPSTPVLVAPPMSSPESQPLLEVLEPISSLEANAELLLSLRDGIRSLAELSPAELPKPLSVVVEPKIACSSSLSPIVDPVSLDHSYFMPGVTCISGKTEVDDRLIRGVIARLTVLRPSAGSTAATGPTSKSEDLLACSGNDRLLSFPCRLLHVDADKDGGRLLDRKEPAQNVTTACSRKQVLKAEPKRGVKRFPHKGDQGVASLYRQQYKTVGLRKNSVSSKSVLKDPAKKRSVTTENQFRRHRKSSGQATKRSDSAQQVNIVASTSYATDLEDATSSSSSFIDSGDEPRHDSAFQVDYKKAVSLCQSSSGSQSRSSSAWMDTSSKGSVSCQSTKFPMQVKVYCVRPKNAQISSDVTESLKERVQKFALESPIEPVFGVLTSNATVATALDCRETSSDSATSLISAAGYDDSVVDVVISTESDC